MFIVDCSFHLFFLFGGQLNTVVETRLNCVCTARLFVAFEKPKLSNDRTKPPAHLYIYIRLRSLKKAITVTYRLYIVDDLIAGALAPPS